MLLPQPTFHLCVAVLPCVEVPLDESTVLSAVLGVETHKFRMSSGAKKGRRRLGVGGCGPRNSCWALLLNTLDHSTIYTIERGVWEWVEHQSSWGSEWCRVVP